ncbi:MAG: sulfurtransferase TusA family protein [Deltaproteobacteria bacterium]|nr:sulfurtransferase TusA family protein [Deltaproteobacteria bacterium]
MKTLDARGMSCPEPLLMLKNALKTEKGIILLVDSNNALDNCRDYARKNGFSVNAATDADNYKIYIATTK